MGKRLTAWESTITREMSQMHAREKPPMSFIDPTGRFFEQVSSFITDTVLSVAAVLVLNRLSILVNTIHYYPMTHESISLELAFSRVKRLII
jgi:hypothetical protein